MVRKNKYQHQDIGYSKAKGEKMELARDAKVNINWVTFIYSEMKSEVQPMS